MSRWMPIAARTKRSRASRDHFGVTPEAVRATTWRDQLELQEPILIYSTAPR
jgi:AraC family transcriptional regulator